MTMYRRALLAALCAVLFFSGVAGAQAWPTRHILVGDATITYYEADFGVTLYGNVGVARTATADVAWVHNYSTNQKITAQASAWVPSTGIDSRIKLEVQYTSPATTGVLVLIGQDGTPFGSAQDLRTAIPRGFSVTDKITYTTTVMNDGLVQPATYTSTVTYTITADL